MTAFLYRSVLLGFPGILFAALAACGGGSGYRSLRRSALFTRPASAPAPLLWGVHQGVHRRFSRCSERLVGAPRFELGTPCTPCKCATRLRHAPTRLFLFGRDSRARPGICRVLPS